MTPTIRTSALASNPDNFSSRRTIPRGLPTNQLSGRLFADISLVWRILRMSWPSLLEPFTMNIPLSVLHANARSWQLIRLALTWKLLGWSRPKVISSVSGLLTSLAMDVHLLLETGESPRYSVDHALLGKTLSYLTGGGYTTTISLFLTPPRFGTLASLESCSTQTRRTISPTSRGNLQNPQFVVIGKHGRTIEITSNKSAASTLMQLYAFSMDRPRLFENPVSLA